MRCVPWLPALVVALLGLCLGGGRADGAAAPRFAAPGDLGCGLALLTRDGTITAGEPLIARVEIENQSGEEIRFRTGRTTHLMVYDPKGALVAATPRPEFTPDDLYSARRLAPDETDSSLWIVTGLCQCKDLGTYSVRVQQLGFPPELPVLCEDAASVEVLPYDASRLEAACEEVFRNRSPFGDLPLTARTKALRSVRDDVVLPYLDWMAREWGDKYACLAVRRIGTPRAEKLIAALSARTDRVGEAARQALEMPLEATFRDVQGQ